MHSFPHNFLKLPTNILCIAVMVIRVVEFSRGEGTKLERFLPKNQHTQRQLLNFEWRCSGELSKIGHHFRKKWFKNGSYQKMSITKIVLLNSYFSMKKKESERFRWFDTYPSHQFAKFNCVSFPLKLHNRYCHTVYPIWTSCPDLKKSLKLNVSTYFTFGSD